MYMCESNIYMYSKVTHIFMHRSKAEKCTVLPAWNSQILNPHLCLESIMRIS